VPQISKTLDKEIIHHRCQLINELEDHLIRNDIHILKFFLNISEDEQKKRIKERKTKPHKKWKYDVADEESSKEWDSYLIAYSMLLEHCNQQQWQIIPADKRWYRNYEVARILLNHLISLNLKYPE